MEEKYSQLKTSIMNCLLKKLTKSYDESENPIEYSLHAKTLEKYIPILRTSMGNYNLAQDGDDACHVLSLLLALYYELTSEGPWNTELSKNYAKSLCTDFNMLYGVTLDELLCSNSFKCSVIFYMMMERLHSLLTVANFKKYPACIEVYCSLIGDLKKFKFEIVLAKALPIALILIEDYIKENKSKGLNACKIILSSLPTNHIKDSNYDEVILKILSPILKEKDLEITNLVLDSLSECIRVMPPVNKENKLDEIFSLVLEETYMEVNICRKSVCIAFISKLIKIHGINCVKEKKKFSQVISENLEQCCYDSIQEVLCANLLECLEEWVKHCWCLITFSTDKIIICSLLKLLYALKEFQTQTLEKVVTITSTIILLCSKEDQEKIIKNIHNYNIEKDSLFSIKLNKLLSQINNI